MFGLFLDPAFFLLRVALVLVIAVAFLLWKERLHRPMWIVRSALFALLLVMLGDSLAQAVGIGVIAGLLWEILIVLSSRRPDQ